MSQEMTTASHGQFRADIQGLRAIAVSLVVIFHIFPHGLSGGYVGVDVFFVISGFLITGILFKQAEKKNKVSFLNFYERRIRRLLPAACTTLVASGLAAFLLLPPLRWQETGWEILSATFYVENFFLYFRSIDYLAEDYAPSAFQHYWSLSIEEQFYVFWPFVFSLYAAFKSRNGSAARTFLLGTISAILLLSLAASIYMTPQNPGTYFITPARIWELALGGWIAVFVPRDLRPGPITHALRWLGLVAIFTAAFLFNQDTLFPGYAALLPTVGTALLLATPQSDQRYDPTWLLALRPMQYTGNISYSFYLWHWPVIVFASVYAGGAFSLAEGIIVGIIATALAHASKTLIEDHFRERPEGTGMSRSYLLGAGFSLAAVVVAVLLMVPSWTASRQLDASRFNFGDYPGAASIYDPSVEFTPRPFAPSLQVVRDDNSDVYRLGCHLSREEVDPAPCVFGPEDAERTIVIAGDSHAAQWIPALRSIADQWGYQLITHTKSACPFILERTQYQGETYPECATWNEAVIAQLEATPVDLLITTKFSSTWVDDHESAADNDARVIAGLSAAWERVAAAGTNIVAIEHTPRFRTDIPECVAANLDDPDTCGTSLEAATEWFDPMPEAAARVGRARSINMNNAICDDGFCAPVVGNVLAYRDPHHLTATFARTLAPALANEIQDYLGAPIEAEASAQAAQGFTILPVGLVDAEHPGAMAVVVPDYAGPYETPFTPAPSRAASDFADHYRRQCHANAAATEVVSCSIGRSDAARTIALVGDRTIASMTPAFEAIAAQYDVNFVTFTKSACPFSSVEVFLETGAYQNCTNWNASVAEMLVDLAPELVVTSQRANILLTAQVSQGDRNRLMIDGLVDQWSRLADAGIPVLAIEQTPRFPYAPADCLTEDGATAASCARPRDEALLHFDPIPFATREVPSARSISLNDIFCENSECPVVIGNVLIYKDPSLPTATFATTLAPLLAAAINADADGPTNNNAQ